jgi:hypothetical protein
VQRNFLFADSGKFDLRILRKLHGEVVKSEKAMSALSISSTLKHDLACINELPDTKSERVLEILRSALLGRLNDSEILNAAEEMQIEPALFQTAIDALSFYVSELIRVAVPKEVATIKKFI